MRSCLLFIFPGLLLRWLLTLSIYICLDPVSFALPVKVFGNRTSLLRWLSHMALLFFLCLSAATMLAAAPACLTTPSQSLQAQSLNSVWADIKCYPGRSGLFGADCLNVIHKLPDCHPSDPNPATFSREATHPRWRLPTVQMYGSCLGIVDTGLLPEHSSWAIIRQMLNAVYDKCVAGGGSGGEVSFGELNGLNFSLQRGQAP